MGELVVLQGRREALTDGQNRLVVQLEETLRKARNGKVRGMVFATVSADGDISLGIMDTDICGVHELVGLSQILNDGLLQVVRDAER